jgi:glycosyltransferase involved in cell wall biosynthesis
VAIYHPTAGILYDGSKQGAGGAERQTFLLARSLAERGLRVAHVVRPVENFQPPPGTVHEVLHRQPVIAGARGKLLELKRVWDALAMADARVYVLRMAAPAVGVAGLFCRLHKRKLIWAGANDGDFTLETLDGAPGTRQLFTLGLRFASTVVVQSAQQVAMAREAFPFLRRVVEIPSFVEPQPAAEAEPEAFVWAGRIVEYKEPFRFLDLAEAVPEARFRMVAVRDGTPQEDIDRLLERAGTLPNLELIQPLPHAELQDLVRRAPALVNTSRLEGMPNVFLEAWSLGVPVLSFQFDPDGRIAEHGLGIAAGGSLDAFADGARRLWSDRAERSRYAGVTREYVERIHGPAAVAERWAQLVA